MKNQLLASVAMLALVATSVSGTPASTNGKITGDYVEAQTASVYAGACHYNGELVTIGREAVMAWNFAGGRFDGVDLSGVRVIAAVASESTLGDERAARKSEIVVDSSATDQQVSAIKSLLQKQNGAILGKIVLVRRMPVNFKHTSEGYAVDASGFASMSIQPMPDDACCKQPANVWFAPLSSLENRKVGFTELATFSGTIGDRWQRVGENSAFYGAFAY